MSDFENLSFDKKSSPAALILSILAALFITAALLSGYLYLRGRHQAEIQAAHQNQEQPAPLPPKVEVVENEPLLKGSQAVITGSVKNISQERLTNLTLELELKRRASGNSEVRAIPIEPSDLAQGEQGNYSLNLDSHSYSGAKILSVKGGAQSSAIVFRTLAGATRPLERTDPSPIVIKSPRKRGGEEFINTPDNPSRVP